MNRFIKIFFIVVSVSVTVSGCTPQKRLQRLLTNYPELRYTKTTDTFTLNKTVYIDTTVTPNSDNYVVMIELDTLFKDTCTGSRKNETRKKIKQLFKEKKCIERPLLFSDTIYYADKEVEIEMPVSIVVMQTANAFNISVQGTGGKVLSHSKAVAVTALTAADIVKYRKQGAWMVGGSLIGLLLLCAFAYVLFKIYGGRFGLN